MKSFNFPSGTSGKVSTCQSGNTKYVGLIAGSGRPTGEGHGNPLQISCLENSWTEEPGGLQSMGSQRVRHDWALAQTHTHTHTHTHTESGNK